MKTSLSTALLGVALTLCATLASATRIDPVASHIGFTLKTRWGQVLEGRFPDAQGDVEELRDGRHQVRLQLATRTVEILGHDAYTRLTRGNGFFDAAEYPWVQFVSDAYSPDLLREGGALQGVLTIRNVRRREVFTISPSRCAKPGRQCDVIASGDIRRQDYGVDRWNFALSDKVRFTLRVRVSEDAAHE
ncbi:MAG: YceI family protein [Luteimonas sp.]